MTEPCRFGACREEATTVVVVAHLHHPSCPARNGTGGCICPSSPKRQLPNPVTPKKTPKVTPRPKRNPKSR